MSIRENLLMVNETATEEAMINACKLANIDDFIDNIIMIDAGKIAEQGKYDELINN